MKDLRALMIEDLRLPKFFLGVVLRKAWSKAYSFKIQKKGGGTRSVLHPMTGVKVIQYWLIKNIFSKLRIHSSATAYVKGTSIFSNVYQHREGLVSLKVDFQGFFPSITFSSFKPILVELFSELGFIYDADTEELILKVCFDNQERLPIGYPTSPLISNAVLFAFDQTVSSFLKKESSLLGKVVYTRYADDLFFSGPKNLELVYKHLLSLTGERSTFPFLKIKDTKTKFYSRGRGNTYLTGLRVCYDGHITLHKKYKDKIRLVLTKRSKGYPTEESDLKLKGHLSYVRGVDPKFYNSLVSKYIDVIKALVD